MAYPLPTYLRTHRRKAGLSQTELAYLIGCSDGSSICRLEWDRRQPNVRTAIACETILRTPLRELFPGMYEEVEISITERTQRLYASLQAQPASPRVDRTLMTLRDIQRSLSDVSAPDV